MENEVRIIKTTTENGTDIDLEISIDCIRVIIADKGISAWGEWGRQNGRDGIIFEMRKDGKTHTVCAVLNEEVKDQIDAIRADLINTRNQEQRERMVPAVIFEGLGLTDVKLGFVIDTGETVYNSDSHFFVAADSGETTDITAIKRDANFKAIVNNLDRAGEFKHIESAIYVISETERDEILSILQDDINGAHEEAIVQNEIRNNKISHARHIAKVTGEAVWFENKGVTEKCRNGEDGCSFDSIDVFIRPDGRFETKFICCY
jgi:hypothetical protein